MRRPRKLTLVWVRRDGRWWIGRAVPPKYANCPGHVLVERWIANGGGLCGWSWPAWTPLAELVPRRGPPAGAIDATFHPSWRDA